MNSFKTKIFPYSFLKEYGNNHFYIRLLPNLTSTGAVGANIIKATTTSAPKHKSFDKSVYLSYAIINNWDDMNRYFKKEVSIIRYGRDIYNIVYEKVEGDNIDIFNLNSNYCIKLKSKYKDGSHFYDTYLYQSDKNIIYDKDHVGKNDQEAIRKLLLDRDISIEQLAIDLSSGQYKSELLSKYSDIIRNEKIEKILV